MLFEGGEFTAESTQLVFYALRFYALALISQSMLEVVVRAFAAQQDTYTPLYISIFTTMVNIGLAIWLTRPLDQGGIAHAGPALANGIAVLIEASIGLTILSIRWKGVDLRRILLDLGKALLASAVMVAGGAGFTPGAAIFGFDPTGGWRRRRIADLFRAVYFLGVKEVVQIPLAMVKRKVRSASE